MTAFSTFTSGSSCRSVELRGPPRPAPPLLLQKASSHAIKKSPPSGRKPVVIHMVSPKVIHVAPGEFMALVQQLTGAAPGSSSSSSSSPPATATITVDETSGSSGRLPGGGGRSPAVAEHIRAPPQLDPPPPSFRSCEEPTRASDQSASWYDFFMAPRSAGGVSSSAALPSPGPYVDISGRVARETT